MNIRFLILSILFFIPIFCIGQTDYKPGFLITNNGDTINGFINLKSNYKNSLGCDFKKKLDEEHKVYSPTDIYAYRIENNKFYVSKTVDLNNDVKTLFLEYLVNGIVDLYYLNHMGNDFYFVEKDGTLHQLSNQEKIVEINGEKRVKQSELYKGALTYLFQDSPETIQQIRFTDFGYKPLVKITKEYHNKICDDYNCIDYTKSTKLKIHAEPQLGMIMSSLGIHTSLDHDIDFKPTFGCDFTIQPPRVHYLWSVSVGINFSSNNFFHDFDNTLYNGKEKTYRIDLNYSPLRIPIRLTYHLPGEKFQPFFSLGYNNIILTNVDYEIIQVKDDKPAIHWVGLGYSEIHRYQYGIIASAGLKYNIKSLSYIYCRLDYEYRRSFVNLGNILDYVYSNSMIVNMGYGFRIN